MDIRADTRKHLDPMQTKSFLSERDSLLANLSDFERLKLDQTECCRTLLANFAYCWSVAEASGLAVVAELAEIGIIDMSVRLGYDVDDIRRSSQMHPIGANSNRSQVTRAKAAV